MGDLADGAMSSCRVLQIGAAALESLGQDPPRRRVGVRAKQSVQMAQGHVLVYCDRQRREIGIVESLAH
ncbi:hypothetical protein OY671_011592, partial [Metschnikowia pulcherrima]